MINISSYYDFIKVNNSRRGSIPKNIFKRRDSFEDLYQMDVTFKVIKPTTVLSGEKTILNDKLLYKIIRNSKGEPYLPGSSLKGVVSQNYLALVGEGYKVSELFGTTYRRSEAISKVFFYPVQIKGSANIKNYKIERAWTPKRSRYNSVKYYFRRKPSSPKIGFIEAIPENTLLKTKIVGCPLEIHEIGGLLLSLGINVHNQSSYISSNLKIGYGKPQAYGQIKVENVTINKINMHYLKIQKVTLKDEDLIKYIIEFKKFVNQLNSRNIDQIFNNLFSFQI
ncbi:MAG: RAMP superfamily CRISPR-associated protein [Promethearchaeota archaeon]